MVSPNEESMETTKFLPFHLGYLTPEMTEKAERELDEHKDKRTLCLQQLRELIQNDKNLKCCTDDEFLLQFLRARKFDTKKSFSCLKNLYNIFCESYSDVFSNHDVSYTKEALRSGLASHLPYRDREGAAVLLVKMSHCDTSKYDTIGILNSITSMVMDAIQDPATQVCGVHLFIDLRGTNFQHLRCCTPRYAYLISRGVKDSIPIRYKAIHLFNASAVFRYIWAMLNVFLTDKIRNRIHFHQDNESLHKFIPKEILPVEYGGDIADFVPAKWSSTELGGFLPKYLRIINHSSIGN